MLVFYSKGRSEVQHNVLNILLPCETLHNSSLIDIRVRLRRSPKIQISIKHMLKKAVTQCCPVQSMKKSFIFFQNVQTFNCILGKGGVGVDGFDESRSACLFKKNTVCEGRPVKYASRWQ